MAGKALVVKELDDRDYLATQIAYNYELWRSQMSDKMNEWKELRSYLFATSTKDTSNASLPWKNTTTTPKLTQLRDNLHANYMDAIFPNDRWFKWEAGNAEAQLAAKKEAIESYMMNKTRINDFRNTVADLLYDYIDYGNAIVDVEYVHEQHVDSVTEENITGYVGPKLIRINPLDIVFNPTAKSFADTPKITRSIKTFGDLQLEANTRPEMKYLEDVVNRAKKVRAAFMGLDSADSVKNEAYAVEGFGSLMEYYRSPYVEVLEFEGSIADESGKLLENQLITVIDRSWIVRQIKEPSWNGKSTKSHVGWRKRPDNLWGMGPLDNLVGMQYRIDHLENIKADLFDLIAHPPIKIRGNVEEFEWAPMAEIFLGDDGDVDILKVDATALQADTQIAILEQRMEDMAGAPKQAMGIRTPGEKTAFEVQSLDNSSGRIFSNRTINFEVNIIDPALNNMLETARRNLEGTDIIRVMDDDLGVTSFLEVTKEDIVASGKLRPVGARHYAARSQLVQNISGVFNSQLGALITPHVSAKAMAKLVEEAFGWERFDIIGDNVGITEQMDTQRLVNAGEQQLEVEQATPGVGETDEVI